tara:strand:+ start:431 stop:805 length:375 start_codon:yes stop_codon:yes gene_type:complete
MKKIYDNLPDWFLYSLPDGIWLFSYLSVLLLIWDNKISKHNIHWVLLIPSIAIFSEIGQLFEIVSGTFDITDLVFYLAGTILPILIFTTTYTKIMIYKKQDRPKCGCGNTQDPNGYCDGSHLNK